MTERAYCAGGKTITRLPGERKRLAFRHGRESRTMCERRRSLQPTARAPGGLLYRPRNNGQALAYVYFETEPGRRTAAKSAHAR